MTSAAGGPAFEGSGMGCAVPAEPGAIFRVRSGTPLHFEVMGGGEPKGVCGSGLVDWIACLRQAGTLSSRGNILRGARDEIRSTFATGFLGSLVLSAPACSLALLPMPRDRRTAGVMVVGRVNQEPFSKDELEILLALGGLFANVVSRVETERELRDHRKGLEELVTRLCPARGRADRSGSGLRAALGQAGRPASAGRAIFVVARSEIVIELASEFSPQSGSVGR